MNAQRWEEIRACFDSIVDLEPDLRASRLAALEESDPQLHRSVESLLKANAQRTKDLRPHPLGFEPDYDRQPEPLGIVGQTISHFDIGEVLGAGGMGIVYRAYDRELGRAVALKFLLPHYSLDASAKARFQREARAAAALDHPNLCTVHEVGTTDRGWLFLAMSLYEGETLRVRLKRDSRLPIDECLDIARQVAEGLQAAHTAGVVHRDLKPGNVMLSPDGTVRILDFGLAKARDQSISETGALFGTVSYMSPEQVRSENVDGRSDLWSLGVLMYEMLTGRKPFDGSEEVGVALAILNDEPTPLSKFRSEISSALETIVLRLLRKDPAKRYASAESLLRDLSRARTRKGRRIDAMLTRWRRTTHAVRRPWLSTPRPVLLAATGAVVLAATYQTVHSVRASPVRAPATVTSSRQPTENSEAHDLYLQGRYFFEKRDSAGLKKAQQYFRRAIAADSSYTRAYTGLADAYALQANFGFEFPSVSFDTAKRYAAMALARDSTPVEVHVSLAFISVFHDWDWPAASREFATALRLNERYAPIHLYRAWYFMATDSNDAAIAELRRAVELDPFSALNNTRLVTVLFYTGHYSEGLVHARQVFERDSNFVGLRQELARLYVTLGRCPEALAALQNSEDQPLSLLLGVRGYTYAKCGRRADARNELNRLLGRARAGNYVSHYALAIVQAGLGDDEQAIAELQKTYIERAPALFIMKLEPAFLRLHADPRFVALSQKVGVTL